MQFSHAYKNAYKNLILNTFINSPEEQDPGSNTKSSIAMSPWELLPRIPSNVTYNRNKKRKFAFKIVTENLTKSTMLLNQCAFCRCLAFSVVNSNKNASPLDLSCAINRRLIRILYKQIFTNTCIPGESTCGLEHISL